MASAQRDPGSQLCKVFVGGISITTSDETFKDYFESYGKVVDSVIIRDQMSNRSKGFGFVTFDKPERVDELLEKRPFNIDGKEVEVKRAIPREEMSPTAHTKTKKLFVGGLAKDVASDDVRDFFKQYGSVDEVQLIYDKETQDFRGFCFVTMGSEDIVDKIVIEQSHTINGKPCTVKKAEPKFSKVNQTPVARAATPYAPLSQYYSYDPNPLDMYYMNMAYGAASYDRFSHFGTSAHARGATSSSLYSSSRGRYRPY